MVMTMYRCSGYYVSAHGTIDHLTVGISGCSYRSGPEILWGAASREGHRDEEDEVREEVDAGDAQVDPVDVRVRGVGEGDAGRVSLGL